MYHLDYFNLGLVFHKRPLVDKTCRELTSSQDIDALTSRHKEGSSTASGGHSQFCPKWPSGHEHSYLSTPSRHRPPLKHLEKKIVKNNYKANTDIDKYSPAT